MLEREAQTQSFPLARLQGNESVREESRAGTEWLFLNNYFQQVKSPLEAEVQSLPQHLKVDGGFIFPSILSLFTPPNLHNTFVLPMKELERIQFPSRSNFSKMNGVRPV